jgi:hypothetical protein
MKKLVVAVAGLLGVAAFGTDALARDTYTSGYINRNGTYVPPHFSTAPNSTRLDNYSTRGNYNPYTGQMGTRDPFPAPTYRTPSATYTNPYSLNPYG